MIGKWMPLSLLFFSLSLSLYLSLFLIQVVIKSIFELLSLMAFQIFFFFLMKTQMFLFS